MPKGERLHILIVEDDPDVAGTIAGLLDDEFRVTVAADGASMRDFLKGDWVDAAIIDVLLPGERGGSLAEFAKSLGIAVVMCSGDLKVIDFAAEHHLQLLRKPFLRRELLAAV